MKLKFSFCLFFGVALSFCFIPNEKSTESQKSILLSRVVETVRDNHFRAITIDDDFSRLMYDQFLSQLDPDKLFFTQVDIEKLRVHQTSIDDEINNSTFQFFEQATASIENNIARSEIFFLNEINKTIDINIDESINLKNKKSAYSKDTIALQTYWRKKIKHNLIHQLSIIEKSETNTSLEEQQKTALLIVKNYYENKFKKYKNVDSQKRFQQYLNAFLKLHDTQSTYMTPKQKDDWDQEIGRSLTGIGVRLNIIDEYPQLVDVTSGGPAWKTGKVDIGDVILKISQDDGTFIDTWGMQIKDFLFYLKGEKDSRVSLHLQKENGKIEVVEIIRDELKMDLAMSFILNHKDNNRKIGYLMLPRFYSGDEDAAIHVAQELELLKANNVDGIVFDVRNNRGGYSNIAIDIMGYFLESGVVMQTQARNQDAVSL